MKLRITIPSPSPDLPEEVVQIPCPFKNPTDLQKLLFIEMISRAYEPYQSLTDANKQIEIKYINN